MATASTARVGLPFRNHGWGRLILGVLIGAVATAMVAALVTSGSISTAPAQAVDGYSYGKVLQQEHAGVGADAAVIAPGPTGADGRLGYTQRKLEQARGEATRAGISTEANLAKVTESNGEQNLGETAKAGISTEANLAKVTE